MRTSPWPSGWAQPPLHLVLEDFSRGSPGIDAAPTAGVAYPSRRRRGDVALRHRGVGSAYNRLVERGDHPASLIQRALQMAPDLARRRGCAGLENVNEVRFITVSVE